MELTITPHSCSCLCVFVCDRKTESQSKKKKTKKLTQGLGNGTTTQCQLAQSSPSHYQMNSHMHRPHTHTEHPPAWVDWHTESTSVIPERHPVQQKDINTHTHAHILWAPGAHGQIGTVIKLTPSL